VPRLTGDLYRRQAEARRGAAPWVLHDGPPYANGALHAGHFMNRVLKDFINRRRLMAGHRVVYVPGWDCHGLPIETKALVGAPPGTRGDPKATRLAARAVAEAAVAEQAADSARWGVLADWEVGARGHRGNVYVTMDPVYEAAELRAFGAMVAAGHVYRGLKPVYWSPSSGTALAEAELEYADAHTSTAAHVATAVLHTRSAVNTRATASLLIATQGRVEAVVWTTTPWTLPANVAIAVSSQLTYVAVAATRPPHHTSRAAAVAGAPLGPERWWLVAESRLQSFHDALGGADSWILTEVWRGKGGDLEGVAFARPWSPGGSPQPSYVICAAHVTEDAGTGLVHTAPGHGHDDFDAVHAANKAPWLRDAALPILCPVDGAGKFTRDAGESLAGKGVFTDGQAAVLEALRASGALLAAKSFSHRYPYDWRTKKPVIIRATQQWFIDVSAVLPACRAQLRGVAMTPPAGRNRLEGMLGSRTEWCISRQRAWGVPIPVLYDAESGEALLTAEVIHHVADIVARHGTDAWWAWDDHHAFLPAAVRAAVESSGRRYVRGTDTLDVWFDSGTSWSAAWASSTAAPACPHRDLAPMLAAAPADAYLEGSDQHRGWFQSSLLSSVAARGVAPFQTIITHGFVLDEAGRKMSKSLGNVVAPRDVIDGTRGAAATTGGKKDKKAPAGPGWDGDGADVLRWWVASSDYTKDTALGKNVLGTVAESVRKLRNTARFLLSNMPTAAELQASAAVAGRPPSPHADAITAQPPSQALLSAWSSPIHPHVDAGGARLSLLARGVLAAAHRFHATVEEGYASLDFVSVTNAVNAFAANDLSASYFDFCKDRLYVGTHHDAEEPRLVMWELLRVLTRAVAPLLPFTAEDVFQHSFTALHPTHPAAMAALASLQRTATSQRPEPGSGDDVFAPDVTVFDAAIPSPPPAWGTSCPEFDAAMALRHQVFKLVEAARTTKAIGSPLEADVLIRLSASPSSPTGAQHVASALAQLAQAAQLEDCFGVSTVAVVDGSASVVGGERHGAPLGRMEGEVSWTPAGRDGGAVSSGTATATAPVVLELHPAAGGKCARCWRRTVPAGHTGDLCARCAAHPAVKALP